MNKVRKLLEMRNISKYFGGIVALDGVNFDVYYKEIVGLVGDNAAGKSTLIKILAGVYSQNRGEIWFEGEKIEHNTPRRAKELGMETVYQNLELVEDLDAPANLFLGRELLRSGAGKLLRFIDKKRMKTETKRIMESLDVRVDFLSAPVRNFSGGQQQIVAIGKTIYSNPKLVIMDEPTSSISVKETRKVLNLAKSLKQGGVSVIIISHNLQEVFSVADRIVVLNRGRKMKDDKIENLTMDEVIKTMIAE